MMSVGQVVCQGQDTEVKELYLQMKSPHLANDVPTPSERHIHED